MPRKVYSDQFKRDAVAMYENDPHLSLKAVAEDLGIYRTTLRAGVDTYGTDAKTQSEASWVWFRFFYGPVLMGSVR